MFDKIFDRIKIIDNSRTTILSRRNKTTIVNHKRLKAGFKNKEISINFIEKINKSSRKFDAIKKEGKKKEREREKSTRNMVLRNRWKLPDSRDRDQLFPR